MITKPSEVNKELAAVIEAGKKMVYRPSNNTVVTITSTDAAEAQQIIEALQPIEDDDAPGYIRESLWFPIMEAYGHEPVETIKWLNDLMEMLQYFEREKNNEYQD